MRGAPAKVILVHGTWGRGFDPERNARRTDTGAPAEPRWFEVGSKFYAGLSSGLSGLLTTTDLSAFLWSGANSIEERRGAAARLAKTLDESVAAAPETPHFIIAHSHGGNVALSAREVMSGNPLNVHIVTMATPFLSIYRAMPRVIDRLFAICLSIGVATFAGYLLMSWATASDFLSFAPLLISLLSIIFGTVTLFCWTYGRFIKSQRPSGHRSKRLALARHINNQTFIASGILFAAGWLYFGRNPGGFFGSPDFHDAHFALFGTMLLGGTALVLPIIIPSLLVFFLSLSIAGNVLYGPQYDLPNISRVITNLKILRSRRDEATLTLIFGKIASFLTYIAASISMIVPIVAASLFVFVLYIEIDFLLSVIRSYSECVASLTADCVNLQVYALAVSVGMSDFSAEITRYVAFGFGVSAPLILLAAMCKSLFGRELLYRSLNAVVDVSDTPDGSNSYNVDWCAPSEESVFSLRHSLYNNPDTLKKIVAHITRVCATEATRDGADALARPSTAPRNEVWRKAAAFVAVGCIYAITASVAYAPSGALSIRCALNSYFEPSAAAGGFTVLVAGFDGDHEGVGDRIAKEIAQRYGFPVIQTCLRVTKSVTTEAQDSSFEEGSAAWLLARYKSDLILWGKVAAGPQVELHVWQHGLFRYPSIQTELKPADIPEFIVKQLQSNLIHAIEYSATKTSSSNSPAILANYADQVDAFAQSVDRYPDGLGASLHDFFRLRDTIGIHVAAGRLMTTAAAASKDGQRTKKAIAFFDRASAMWDGAGDEKKVIPNDWRQDENIALLLDARLNKDEGSAKLAASRYLADYEEDHKNGNASYDLAADARKAASAAFEVYTITRDQDAASSSIRLSCVSLLLLRYWQADEEAIRKRNLELAQQGRVGAVLPNIPPPEQSEAYKILVRFGKDPSSIFAPGPKMKLKDCEAF